MSTVHDYWRPYEPTAVAPWNLRRVVHLHRRAGFAATWAELQRDLAGDPQHAVTRLLEGRSRIDGQPSDYASMAPVIVDTALKSNLDRRLKAAWVYRMLYGPDPLGERLVLMWHNHFATSNAKVNNLALMQKQNETFRQHARAPIHQLLSAVTHGPAMLGWLDADKNVAGRPNENLARELMELFTLGVGHYTEMDVQEAARSLTGWTVVDGQFSFDPQKHDDKPKTILGVTSRCDGDALLQQLVNLPPTARRLSWRICRLLLADAAITDKAIDELATGLRRHELNVAWGIETVVRSAIFFGQDNLGNRVTAPPQYVVGIVRALETFDRHPSTLLMADWMARMGQDSFYPPNVGGWNEGRSWLSSGAIVARANFAAALVTGGLMPSRSPPALQNVVERHIGKSDLNRSVQVVWRIALRRHKQGSRCRADA